MVRANRRLHWKDLGAEEKCNELFLLNVSCQVFHDENYVQKASLFMLNFQQEVLLTCTSNDVKISCWEQVNARVYTI